MLLLTVSASGQQKLLNHPDRLDRVNTCLQETYNYHFREARAIQQQLYKTDPLHPAYSFLNALIIYWENFPLIPADRESDLFISELEKTIKLADDMLSKNPEDLEGLFFDLFGRAFRAMYWSDNGHPAKVIADLDNMYRVTMKGFALKDKFNEFYFSTGLYNYYIEAYPVAHPVYKPFATLLKSGNTRLGIQQLQYAIDYSTYIRVESLLFMTLLQLNYEKDYEAALNYASELYRSYSNNVYYMATYALILLRTDNFSLAEIIEAKLRNLGKPFPLMISGLIGAYIDEKDHHAISRAKNEYYAVIERASEFGPFAGQYEAIAWMGLARIYREEGNKLQAGRCYKKASGLTSYDYILSDGWTSGR